MGFSIASPNEEKVVHTKSPVQEAVKSGLKIAILCTAAAAVPTALIISAAGIAGFFITADRSILESARGNTIGKHDK